MERIQKIIAQSGYCSRRKAEELIKNNKVHLNGNLVTDLGTKASNKDIITIDGKTLKKEEKEYILLYKPRGVITSVKDEKGRKTVLDLIKTKNRLYPVGRLDYDTSGLLILTNDGDLTNLLTHPSKEIEKVYVAKVEGIFTSKEAKQLEKGVIIDNIKTAKSKVKIRKRNKDKTIVQITIHEGRYHQVRKMFEVLGYKVITLKREKYSFLDLRGLTSGEYRHLNPKEVKKLYNECQKRHD